MIPQRFDFPDLYKGDTYQAIHFVFSGAIGDAAAEVLDLTDCTALIQLRRNGRLFHTFDCVVTENEGKVSIVPDVINIPGGTYDVDVQLTLASGAIKTYLRGECTVVEDVSHE